MQVQCTRSDRGFGGGRLRWGDCERLSFTLAGSQPDRNCVGIAISPSDRLTCRHAHVHPCRERPDHRATRAVGRMEEHPLGVRAGDYALHRGGPVRDADS